MIESQGAITGHLWRNNILKALRRYENDTVKRKTALFNIALKVVEKALEGDVTMIREIGDRLDGKPAQAITGPQGEAISLVECVIIAPAIQDDSQVIEGEIIPDNNQSLTTNK